MSDPNAFAVDRVVFDAALIARFGQNAPRYTSYPTADRFTEDFCLADRPKKAARPPGAALSLYFHLPFCKTPCYYCACHKIVTKDRARLAEYLRYLFKEVTLKSAGLSDADKRVGQLHWGGGTPTFLSDDEMARLMDETRRHFHLAEEGEYSIEVAPRGVGPGTIARLAGLGFNRLSVGVQDFDENVLRAVNRSQSEDETRAVIERARERGFTSVGIDLIYGLPQQTADRFARTLDRVIALNPDRLSVFNYAHLPALFRAQRRIDAASLPSADERLRIFALTIKKLVGAGYVFIGMDHFARPGDELSAAQRENRLYRNFQGYSIRPEGDMLAFGVSAISQTEDAYYQNVKTPGDYYRKLDRNEWPVSRGKWLDRDDRARRFVIQSLMCGFNVSFAAVEAAHAIDFPAYFKEELAELAAMADAGLVMPEADRLVVLPAGRLLIRAIAAVFDRYRRRDRESLRGGDRYSKIV